MNYAPPFRVESLGSFWVGFSVNLSFPTHLGGNTLREKLKGNNKETRYKTGLIKKAVIDTPQSKK